MKLYKLKIYIISSEIGRLSMIFTGIKSDVGKNYSIINKNKNKNIIS
jgi:hypothetical protein